MGEAKITIAELTKKLEAAQSRISELEVSREGAKGIAPDAENRYRDMFENAQVGLYRSKIDGSGPVMVNQELAEILGFTVDELMSQPTIIRWADPAKRGDLVALVEEKGIVTNYEIELLTKNGDIKTCLVSVKPYPEEGLLEGTLVDITDRKRTENDLRYRMKFEEVIANISANFISLPFEKTDEAINSSLESIGWFCGVDRSCVSLFSEDMKTMSDTHEWCNEDIEPRINDLQEVPLDLFGERLEELKRTGVIHTRRLEDLPPGTDVEKDMSEEHGTKSYLLVVITSESRVIGFISLNTVREEREWGDGDIALLKIAANIFANVIERQKKVKALQESEQRLRNLLDTTTDWVWEIDEDGVYTYSSPAVKKILGYEPDDILGMSPFDLMPEEEAGRLSDTIGPVIAARKPIKLLDNVNLDVEGNKVVLETNAVPFFDADGEFRGYRGIDRDVTELVRVSERSIESE